MIVEVEHIPSEDNVRCDALSRGKVEPQGGGLAVNEYRMIGKLMSIIDPTSKERIDITPRNFCSFWGPMDMMIRELKDVSERDLKGKIHHL